MPCPILCAPSRFHRDVHVGSEPAGQRVMASNTRIRNLPAGDCETHRCCSALNRGCAADFGPRCRSDGRGVEHDFANSANGVGARTWRHKPPAVLKAGGVSQTRPPWPWLYRMPTLQSSGASAHGRAVLSSIRRTAVFGSGCTVVRRGGGATHPPMPV